MDIKSIIGAFISRSCTVILALLGYNCSSEGPWGGGQEEMYGTPYGTFEVKGAVTNEDGQPVADAEIKVTERWFDSGLRTIASTVTAENGSYIITSSVIVADSLKIVCIPSGDVYQPDSIKVKLEYHYDKEHKEDDWYEGHAVITEDFRLKVIPGE